MSSPEPSIRVKVDVTNPGQFFACCGLLELADRLWPGAEGWFEKCEFCIKSGGSFDELHREIDAATLEQLDTEDDMSSAMRLTNRFDLVLDWWSDEIAGGKQLKVWAGSMRNVRIARAMKHAIRDIAEPELLFDHAAVVYDPDQKKKKVEPFYFDSRRGQNAQSLDIGFAPDSLKMTTFAYPAVEFLCLVGLQRNRPEPMRIRRVFEYHTWESPTAACLVAATVCGKVAFANGLTFRFENAFRTAQKKHKSFLPATLIGSSL